MKSINLAFSLVACGQAEAQGITTFTWEKTTCGNWIAYQDPATLEVKISWIRGFLTGINFETRDKQIDGASPETVKIYVDKWCKDNPLGSWVGAAFQLARDLKSR